MTKRVLIISSAEISARKTYNDEFVAELNARLGGEVSVEWHNYKDFEIVFDDGVITVTVTNTGEQLTVYDFVYFKSFFRYHDQAVTIATYLRLQNIPFVSSELKQYIPLTKLSQTARLTEAKLPIAKTIYMDTVRYATEFQHLAEELGVPFIFKATDGAGGRDNYLINSQTELNQAVLEAGENHFIAQKFIENDSDLRILIVGNTIELIIRRERQGDTHLNNTSQGASATFVEPSKLSETDAKIALNAAKIMGREVAGVDLMYETTTGDPYILEVNASPQIGTGAFQEEKIALYCKYFRNVVK